MRAEPPNERSKGAAVVDLAALGILFVALAALSWRRWADPHVDFGQQLYVAWRLAEGEVLYRDLAYLHGPLSPYANSLLFRLFGVSYSTLIGANLAVTGMMAALLHRSFGRSLGRDAGLTAAAVFLAVFAFGQYVGTANYNWVSPYAHSATHGVLLFAVLALAVTSAPPWTRRRALLTGAVVGCLLLTRAEVASAALGAIALYLGVAGRSVRPPLAPLLGGAVLPPLVALALFSLALPAPEALRATAGAWVRLFDAAGGTFFTRGAGLDDPWLSLQVTLAVGLSAAFVVVLAAASALAWRAQRTPRGALVGTSALVLAGVGWVAATTYTGDLGRGLPVLAVAPVLVWGLDLVRSRGADRTAGAALPFLWALFGLLMLTKTLLNARIHQYGFYLSVGAAVAVTVLLVSELPRRVKRVGGNGALLRLTMVLLVAVLSGRLVAESARYYSMKTEPVGRDGDLMLTYGADVDSRTEPFAATLRHLAALPPGATVQALPEGVMLNYLSRRVAPSRFTNFMVTEVDAFGEAAMLADLQRADPDVVVLVHKDTSEYGVGYFGADDRYGGAILRWIRRRYEPVHLEGAPPLRTFQYGIEVSRRYMPEPSTEPVSFSSSMW